MDAIAKLADDVKNACFSACAKVPGILRIRSPENDYQRGYNAACADVEQRIRNLTEASKAAQS